MPDIGPALSTKHTMLHSTPSPLSASNSTCRFSDKLVFRYYFTPEVATPEYQSTL